MYAKLSTTQVTLSDVQNSSISKFADVERRIRRIEEHVRMIARGMALGARGRDHQRTAAGERRHAVGLPEVGKPATLFKCARTLNVLWDEYVNGIGGRKPARDFTRVERGRVKDKYSKRLIVWRCITRLLNRGYDLSTAFNKITRVYGDISMTELIKKMRPDERRGGHASLR